MGIISVYYEPECTFKWELYQLIMSTSVTLNGNYISLLRARVYL